jgi:hypothetical protein
MRFFCLGFSVATLLGCATKAPVSIEKLNYVAGVDIGVIGYRETLIEPGRFHIVYENDEGTCEQAKQLALKRAGELCIGRFVEIPMVSGHVEIRSCDSHAYRPCLTVLGQAWIQCVP